MGGGVYGNSVNGGNGFGSVYGDKFPYANNGAFFGTGGGFNGQQQGQYPVLPPPYNQLFDNFWKQFYQNQQK